MNGLDKVIEHLNHAHTYVDVNDKNIFYYVDCSVIQDYGQVETFDKSKLSTMSIRFMSALKLEQLMQHLERVITEDVQDMC